MTWLIMKCSDSDESLAIVAADENGFGECKSMR